MTASWKNATRRLDQTTARLGACAPDDFSRLAQVLAERQQAIEEVAALAGENPAGASPAALDDLSAASAAGRELAIRLQLQTAALRRQLAAETARSRLLHSLASPEPTGNRINVRS